MSNAGIRRLAEALEELRRDLPAKERTVESRRADYTKAQESLAAYHRTIAALEADIEALKYAERLAKLYGKDPRQ